MKAKNQNVVLSLAMSLSLLTILVSCHAPPGTGKKSNAAAANTASVDEDQKTNNPNCSRDKVVEAAVANFEKERKIPRVEILGVADIGLRSKVRVNNTDVAVNQVAIYYSNEPGRTVRNVYVREDNCRVAASYETQFVTTDSEMAKELPCELKNKATANQQLAIQLYTGDQSSPYEIDSGKSLHEMYKVSDSVLTLMLAPKENCAAAQSFERSLNPAPEKMTAEASKK